jgi:hypothetical protein
MKPEEVRELLGSPTENIDLTKVLQIPPAPSMNSRGVLVERGPVSTVTIPYAKWIYPTTDGEPVVIIFRKGVVISVRRADSKERLPYNQD